MALDAFDDSASHVDGAIVWLADGAKPAGRIDCEHEPEHVDEFPRTGYLAETATTDRDAGIAAVRKRLADDTGSIDDSGDRLPVAVDGGAPVERVGLLVAARCEQLVLEFLGYKDDHVGKAIAEDHCLDALRDACLGVSGQ